MAGTVAEVDSPERLLWLSSQVSSQVFTVVVFLRGHWCPFDKANAQVWEYYHTAIQENNGKLIGIVTHDADYCTKIITHWKLSFNLLSDPEAIIAANYSVPLTSTNQTPFKPGYEQAKYKYNQAGVVVLTPNTDQPLYIWRTNPQFSNFDGASGRPMPKCILDNVLHQIKGSPGEPPKISRQFLSSVKNTKISAATIQEEQLQLTEELREMESEYATEYISHWWKLEREKHTYTILVVYRGSWCAFCRGWLKRWNKVVQQAALHGVKVFGISSQTQKKANKSRLSWKLDYPLIGCPTLSLTLGKLYSLHITSKIGYPHGMCQPAVLVYDPRKLDISYNWICKPTVKNLRGGTNRPDPYDLWLNLFDEIVNNRALYKSEDEFESYKYSREFLSHLPKTIHYGNPLTLSGYKPAFRPHTSCGQNLRDSVIFDFSDSDDETMTLEDPQSDEDNTLD